jgi:hypothetical protein
MSLLPRISNVPRRIQAKLSEIPSADAPDPPVAHVAFDCRRERRAHEAVERVESVS